MARTTTNGTGAGGKRRARGSLSEDEILTCARRLVEDRGLAGLSMPALAKELSSGVTSIYWYFRSKDELLQALANRVTVEIYGALPPVGDGPWDQEIVEYFASFRDLLEATPLYREVFSHRARMLFLETAMGRPMLGRLEDGLRLFIDAGLTAQRAVDAFNACSNFTRGFILLEHGPEGEPSDTLVDPALSARLQAIAGDRYPVLDAVPDLGEIVWLGEDQFRHGLSLIVDGIRARYSV